jgi:hypothetical protein
MLKRILFFAYGILSYMIFFGTFLYAVGFIGNFWVPSSLDGVPRGTLASAFAIDAGLLALTARSARDYSRVFFASASQESPDAQGRITVPPTLRDYAGLTKDCVVIGADTRVEVWDAESWQRYLDEREQNYADAEEVIPGVL